MKKNIPLRSFHTFGIAVQAMNYTSVDSEAALQKIIPLPQPNLILGGGSNILFTKDFPGLVVHNNIKGIEVVEENQEEVLLRVGGGEIWHQLVLWCLKHNYGGIENLSLIPGSVGAAPIQNIGAYGVELKDIFHSLEAIDLATGEVLVFNKRKCQFSYRESIFKRVFKGKYLIARVLLKLTKGQHHYNVTYGVIQKVLDASNEAVSIHSISKAIIQIRESKLPDPKKIGNSGSFFKNPVVSLTQFIQLKNKYPNLPYYPTSDTEGKIAAGWLIDNLGWKGYRKGDAGVHKDQALVLVNYGNAKGQDVLEIAQAIQKDVLDNYGIILDPEVNIL